MLATGCQNLGRLNRKLSEVLFYTSKTGALNDLHSKFIQVTALAERYMLGNYMPMLPSADFFRDNLF